MNSSCYEALLYSVVLQYALIISLNNNTCLVKCNGGSVCVACSRSRWVEILQYKLSFWSPTLWSKLIFQKIS